MPSPEPSHCTGCKHHDLSGPERDANKIVPSKLVLSSQQSQAWTTHACSLTHLSTMQPHIVSSSWSSYSISNLFCRTNGGPDLACSFFLLSSKIKVHRWHGCMPFKLACNVTLQVSSALLVLLQYYPIYGYLQWTASMTESIGCLHCKQ
jgi:hypothetical protein